MKLSTQDVALFFRLTWLLQFYVNQRLGILSRVTTVEKYSRLPAEDKQKVRAALYEHPELIDEFVASNPGGLSPDQLEIVQGWKRFVAGSFFIDRFLKKGAIFIAEHKPPNVYLVLALGDDFEEVLPPYPPPFYVRTVLLPFRGQVIYDGLLESYQIVFGSGIRSSLREDYLRAKQRGEIITHLEAGAPAAARPETARPAPELVAAVDEIVAAADKLKAANLPIAGAALTLLKASAHLAQATVQDPDDLAALWEQEEKAQRALARLERALDRAG
jgi:hypothetical protein